MNLSLQEQDAKSQQACSDTKQACCNVVAEVTTKRAAPRSTIVVPRLCRDCDVVISELPANFYRCAECYTKSRSKPTRSIAAKSKTISAEVTRRCLGCQVDISDLPTWKSRCIQCHGKSVAAKSVSRQPAPYSASSAVGVVARRCVDCQVGISSRPANHSRCGDCYEKTQRRACAACKREVIQAGSSYLICKKCTENK